MKKCYLVSMAFLVCMMTVGVALADTLISKPPDIGPWWNPVGNDMSYIYGDCFIAPDGGDLCVATLGTWLELVEPTPGAEVRFEIWGTAGNGGPDCLDVIAKTDPMQTDIPSLTLYTLPVVEGAATLIPGEKYWFVINGFGMGNPSWGSYRTGGHTQNSVYPDNCTFWYSNENDGCTFGGQNLTPEMAFEVMLIGMTGVEELSWGCVKGLYR